MIDEVYPLDCRRLPGCPDAASKLLQAARQTDNLPVSYSAVESIPAEQVNGDVQVDNASDAMLSPTPEGQQVDCFSVLNSRRAQLHWTFRPYVAP